MKYLKTRILSALLAVLFAAGCFAEGMGGMTAYAADSSHQATVIDLTDYAEGTHAAHNCIWSTGYDASYHWEFCTICGAERGKTAHSYTDHWAKPLGDGIYECTYGNYSIRTCSCGYSYTYRKACVNSNVYHGTGNRTVHYALCSTCGSWADSGLCEDADGNTLSCKNPGTCVKCGTVIPENCHRIRHGICEVCDKRFYTETEPVIRYNSDYSKATVSFSLTPLNKAETKINDFVHFCATHNWKDCVWKTETNSTTGAVSFTVEYTFDERKPYQATDRYCNGFGVTIDGVDCFVNDGPSYTIWQDHTAPVIGDIVQNPQTYVNGWATIQKLSVRGTDDMSDTMSLLITNSAGEKICSGTVDVTSGKYVFDTTPEIEGSVNGTTYTVTVADRCGNKTTKNFVVKKTDSKPPKYTAASVFHDKWAKIRQVTFTATDDGSGDLQIAFNDLHDFKAADKTGSNSYARTYQFTGDLYTDHSFKVYIKDAVGNITTQTVKIGNLDNTSPEFTGLAVSDSFDENGTVNGWNITAKANDVNHKLSAAGSGICGYAVTQEKKAPEQRVYQKSETLYIPMSGTYYIWAQDAAGNVSVSDAETILSDLMYNGKHVHGSLYNEVKLNRLYYNGKRIRL